MYHNYNSNYNSRNFAYLSIGRYAKYVLRFGILYLIITIQIIWYTGVPAGRPESVERKRRRRERLLAPGGNSCADLVGVGLCTQIDSTSESQTFLRESALLPPMAELRNARMHDSFVNSCRRHSVLINCA